MESQTGTFILSWGRPGPGRDDGCSRCRSRPLAGISWPSIYRYRYFTSPRHTRALKRGHSPTLGDTLTVSVPISASSKSRITGRVFIRLRHLSTCGPDRLIDQVRRQRIYQCLLTDVQRCCRAGGWLGASHRFMGWFVKPQTAPTRLFASHWHGVALRRCFLVCRQVVPRRFLDIGLVTSSSRTP